MIRRDLTCAPRKKRSTLLHKALHVVHDSAGIDGTDRLNPERFIRRCEAGLLPRLRHNPDLVAYRLAP